MLNLERYGIEILTGLPLREQLRAVADEVAASPESVGACGIRDAEKKFASLSRLLMEESVLAKPRDILHGEPRLVRAIFFDKTPDGNWLVTWHQDRTVAVDRRFEAPGWGPWSLKDGVHHVQPPLEVLENMLTLRLHIDAADKANGCLKVIPGSHRYGVLGQDAIRERVGNGESVFCEVGAGDAVLMRPLILHASSKAMAPVHRRVVHLEFSALERPAPSAAWT